MMKLTAILFVIFYLIDENFAQNNPIEDSNIVFIRSKGGYTFRFRTNDIDRFEAATFPGTDKSDKINLNVFGYYSFTGSDGRLYSVRYEADDKGYHPIVAIGVRPSVGFEPIETVVIKSLAGSGIG